MSTLKKGKHCCFPGGVAAHAVHIPRCMTLMLGQGQWDSAAEQSLGLFQSGFVETGNEGINSKQGVTLHFLSAIFHRMSHKHSSELRCDESNKWPKDQRSSMLQLCSRCFSSNRNFAFFCFPLCLKRLSTVPWSNWYNYELYCPTICNNMKTTTLESKQLAMCLGPLKTASTKAERTCGNTVKTMTCAPGM